MFVHRLSKLFVNESPSSSSSKEEDEGFIQRDDLKYLDKVFHSGTAVDRRFLSMFKVMNKPTAKDLSSSECDGASRDDKDNESVPGKQYE